MSARRKSTNYQRRRPVPDLEGDQTERRISPQERRRQIMIQVGVWFLVVVFAMTSGVMCFSPSAEEQNQQAAQATPQDEIQVEIDRWTREVGSSPNDPVALANLGHYWRLKAETLRSKDAAPAPAPAQSPAASPQASPTPQMTREQAWSQAEEYLERAVKSDSNYAFALQEMAELRMDQERNPEARALLQKILALAEEPVPEGQDPTTIMANRANRRNMALLSMVRLEAAEKNYDRALQTLDELHTADPGNLEVYGLRAQIHRARGDLGEALKAYDEVIKVGQGMQDQGMVLGARLERSRIFVDQKDKDAARKELEQARTLAQGSGNPQATMLVNYFLYQLDGPGPAVPPVGLPTGPSPAAQPGSVASPVTPAEAAPSAPPATPESSDPSAPGDSAPPLATPDPASAPAEPAPVSESQVPPAAPVAPVQPDAPGAEPVAP